MTCRAESVVPEFGLPSRDAAAPRSAEALTWRELDVLLLLDGRCIKQGDRPAVGPSAPFLKGGRLSSDEGVWV
jgi:hypothetical protein